MVEMCQAAVGGDTSLCPLRKKGVGRGVTLWRGGGPSVGSDASLGALCALAGAGVLEKVKVVEGGHMYSSMRTHIVV